MASIVTRAARAARAAGGAAATARRAISSTAACRARYSSDPYAVPEDYPLPAEPVPGRDASTNYILAYADVPVNKRRLTYKNLSSRQLAGLAGKAAGKNGVFTASAGAGCARKVAGSTDQTGATTVSFEEADDIIDGVMSYLARTPALYVEDAMVGSASGSEIRVVGVTEDPASAAVLRAVLEKAPKSKMASKRPMKVYVAPGCPVEEPTALVLVEEPTAKVVIAGAVDEDAMCAAIHSAAAGLSSGDDNLYLNCDTYASSAGKTALVFGGSSKDRSEGFASGMLVSGHGSVWTDAGVGRLLGGVCLDPAAKVKAQAGDVKLDKRHIVSRVAPNVVASPATIIFAGEGLEGKTPAEMVQQADSSVSAAGAELFQQRVEAGSVQIKTVPAKGVAAAVAAALK